MEKVKDVIDGLVVAAALFSVPYLISLGWYKGKKHGQQ